MATGKNFPITIAIGAKDSSAGALNNVSRKLERMAAPVDRLGRRFRRMSSIASSGLRGVGRHIGSLAKAFVGVAASIGLSVHALKGWIDAGDVLAKTADRIGFTVDGLASLRFAASQSGTDVSDLDKGLEGLSKRVGEAKAGTGSLATFLQKTSPALLRQVKAAKSNEEAFSLMTRAIAKLEDPTKRSALASAAFGRAGMRLTNLLSQGEEGVAALRGEYIALAGSQEGGARASEKIKDALGRVSAVADGLKSSIILGLAPAFLKLAERAKVFFQDNRGRIQEWVEQFGRKLPGYVDRLVSGITKIGGAMSFLVEHAKELALVFGAFKVAGLLGSVGAAGGKLATFAGGLSSAVAGLGLFAAGLMAAANYLDKQQEKAIQRDVDTGTARRNFLGLGAGRASGLAYARETGIMGKDGRINTSRLRSAITEDGKLTRGSEVNSAIAGLVQAQQSSLQRGLIDTIRGGVQRSEAKVKIEVAAPPGTRAKVDRASTADLSVDMSTGPLMGVQ